MLKLIRTNFDRKDARRDRRAALRSIVVKIAGIEHPVLNCSLGGLLLGGNGPEIAEIWQGEMRFTDRDDAGVIAFTAEAVRCDDEPAAIACRFIEPSAALIGVLDRGLAARVARAGR